MHSLDENDGSHYQRASEKVESWRRDASREARQKPSEQQLQPTVYSHQRSKSNNAMLASRSRPVFIEEEQIEADQQADSDTVSSTSSHGGRSGALAFEIIPPRQFRDRSRSRAQSRRRQAPEVRKVRVKVYADDTRYVMISPDIQFPEFVDQIRRKFGSMNSFKLKMRDEDGDMVTMGDQDDLDMAITASKNIAATEGAEMGKMDVRLISHFFPSSHTPIP